MRICTLFPTAMLVIVPILFVAECVNASLLIANQDGTSTIYTKANLYEEQF